MIDMADLTNALAHAGIDMEKQGVAFLLEGAWPQHLTFCTILMPGYSL